VLFLQAGVPLPEGLEKFPGATLDPNARAPIDIQTFVRDNIDPIGNKLMEDNQKELLFSLGEMLAAFETDKPTMGGPPRPS